MNNTEAARPWSHTAFHLALIAGLALLVDTYFFAGFLATSDDNCNLLAAHRLVGGQPYWQAEDPRTFLASAFRLALTLPSALLYYLGRGRIFWVTYGHIAYHLALIPLAYWLGRLLHGRGVGLLAALLAALHPLFYVHAGACLPDNALSMWLGLATLALFHARQRREELAGRPLLQISLVAGAGFCLGLAYSCKETGLLMLLPAALLLLDPGRPLLDRRTLGRFLALGLGFLLFLGLEQVILHALTGRWVWRLEIIAQAEEHYLTRATVDGLTPGARAARAWQELARFAPVSTVLSGAALLAYPFLRGAHRLLWFIPLWLLLYMTFGSTSPWRYVPGAIMDRYYAIAMLPLLVMLARLALATGERLGARLSAGGRRRLLGLAAALPVALVLLEMGGNLEQAGEIYRTRQVRSLVEALQTARSLRPELPVVISRTLSDRMLALFLMDQDKAVLHNSLYHHFRQATPEPPFVYLGDYQGMDQPAPSLDLPPRPDGRAYEASLWKVIRPGFSRHDVLLQGNALAGLNPVLAGRRIRLGGSMDTYIVLVEGLKP